MSTGSIRRAQLVSPFGVGALSILVNGTSVITAGLDHWYESDDTANLYPGEFAVDEWRLQQRLRVTGLRLPPDHRTPVRGARTQQRNLKLTVPVLRFPRWSFCIYCKRLELSTLSMAQLVRCPDDKHHGKRAPVMSQVPFIAICERGHLDDFPFNEWVHRKLVPSCNGPLRLLSQGGGTLAGQVVKCEPCDIQRPLEGILQGSVVRGEERTVLTDQLAPSERYECVGSRPWLADPGEGCGQPLRGALRAAGNVYFPKVESSIFLPRHESGVSSEVLDVLRRADVQPVAQLLYELQLASVSMLRSRIPAELLNPFGDAELEAGLQDLFGVASEALDPGDDDAEDLTSSVAWRYDEFDLLRETPAHPDLTATDPGVPDALRTFLGRVRRVAVLRETRALRGFTRVRDGSLRLSEGKRLLRRAALAPQQEWLPAYVVKGEGIYFEFDALAIANWESRGDVQARARRIDDAFHTARQSRGLPLRDIRPRAILLHTTAHLIINELVFTCGYSSAALRERLYASTEPGREMAGVLIYTAAGDSEGTMGGLVRMARPENLSAVFQSALARASWCSTDPVCMELGEAGQGPESCNLAACHGCALLPETSCEEFNRFLDRGLVIGTFNQPDLGFFNG